MELILYKFTYLLTALGGLFVLFLIFFRKIRVKFNILYALLNIAMIIWAIGRYALLVVGDYNSALIWVRILYIGSILVHLFFLHTILVYLEIEEKRKPILYLVYANALFILCVNILDLFLGTQLFVYDVVDKLDFKFYEIPGVFYNLHLINYLFIPQYAFIEMLLSLRHFKGQKKSQLKFLLYSSVFGFIGGNSVVPLIYGLSIPPLPVVFVPVHLFTMAYAIFKFRLMDIRAIIFRSIAFGFILLLITSIFAVIATLISSLFAELAGVTSNVIAGLIIAIIVTTLYLPTRKLIEGVTNTFLYKRSYNPDILLSSIRDVTSSTLDLKHLLQSLCDILETAFNCEKIKVALLETKKDRMPKLNIAYKKGFESGAAEKFVEFPGVVRIMHKHFKEYPGIQVIDELYTKYENGEYKPVSVPLLQVLHDTNIAVMVPLFTKEKLIGLLVLGTKKSGDPYSSRDIQILNIISGQLAISIENAQLYGHLEELVDVRTEELHTANEKLGVANKLLKKLDEAKSEFLSIASHQLRTPLTAVKGYISMMNEGSFGKVPKNLEKYLSIVYVSNERLISLVNDLLNLSRIEAGKQKYDFQKTDLCSLTKEIITQLKPWSDQKGISVSFEAPKNIPHALADQEKIHEVMMNFIDNAIKYTAKGGITIFLKAEPQGMITFSVKDSGVGISKENIGNLFKKFSRVGGSLVHTEGTGLGLYVAKMIIEAHKGKIWAESEGEGKGSTFSFSVPMAK